MTIPKIKLFCRVFFIFLVLLTGSIYWFVTKTISLENIKSTLVQEIEDATGMPVTIGNAEFALLEGLGFHLENVTLGEKSSRISFKELWINLAPAHLLSKKIKIEKISLRSPSFEALRNKDGQFSISGLEKFLRSSSGPSSSDSRELDFGKSPTLIIQDGTIVFRDYKSSEQATPIRIQDLNIIAKKPFPLKPIDLSLHGELPSSTNPATVAISGKLYESSKPKFEGKLALHDISAEHLKSLFKKFDFPFQDILVSLDGDLNTDFDGTIDFSGEAHYKLKDLNSNNEIKLPSQGIIKVKFKLDQENFEIENFDFQSNPINLKGNLVWANYNLPESRLTISTETSPISTKTIPQLLPAKWLEENPSFLDFGNGSIRVQSLRYDGAPINKANWNLSEAQSAFSGNILFQKTDWDLDGFPLKNFDGLLKIKSGKTDLTIDHSICPKLGRAELKGKIFDIFGKDPQIKIEFQGAPPPDQFLKDLKTIIPDPAFVKAVSRFENTYGSGVLKGHLTGPLKFNDNSSLYVSYKIAKAGFDDKQTMLPFRKIDGLIEVKHEKKLNKNGTPRNPWEIIYSGFKGKFGDGLILNMQGDILFGNSPPSIKSSAKLSINAKSMPGLLSKRLGEKWFSNLQKVDFTDGVVIVDISRKGKFSNNQWGNYNSNLEFKDVAFNLHNLGSTTGKLSGNANISDEKIQLQKLVGNLGESFFQIDGVINQIKNETPIFDIVINSPKFSQSKFSHTRLFQKINLTGDVGIISNLKGSLNDLQFITELNLDSAGYKLSTFEKIPGGANSIHVEGRFKSTEFIEFKNFRYKIQDAIIRGGGKFNLLDSQNFVFNLFGENISIKSIAPSFSQLRNMESGVANISVKGNGLWTSLDNIKLNGTLKVGDASFRAEGFTHPLVLNANIDLDNSQSIIKSATLTSSDSAIQFSGNYSWDLNPKLNLKVSGQKLDFNDTWPGVISLEEIRKSLFQSELFNNGTAKIEFQLGYFEFLFWNLNSPSGKVYLKDKSFTVEDFKVLQPNSGLIEAGARFSFPQVAGIQIDSFFTSSQIQAKDFFSIFGKTFDNAMTGTFEKLDGAFQTQGAQWKEFRKSFNAQLNFDLTAGTFSPHRLLAGSSELFGFSYNPDSEENPSDFQPYKKISAGFRSKNGVATTENFIYQNDARGMTLAGIFDLNQNEMDNVVGVAHLPGVDEVLTQIPLVGKILTAGSERSLVKTYYTLKGNFSSPKMEPIPFTSFQKKFIGTFQGIIETPTDILMAPLKVPSQN